MEVELVAHTPDPAWVIEQAASVCYDSTPTRECKLVMQCYRSGHHSVLEHASFTFKISGISRACSHQLVRHRMASYSQRSQRYCDEDGFGYVTPPSIELSSYHDSIENALDEYVHLKNSMGRPAEDARYVLPNACVTTIYVTMNLRSLIIKTLGGLDSSTTNQKFFRVANGEICDLMNDRFVKKTHPN